MNDRIHSYLDGRLPRSTLSPTEECALARFEEAVGVVSADIRTAPVPDLTARVMSSLPDSQRAPSFAERLSIRVHSGIRWLWTPHELVLRPRPAYAFGLAVALVALVLGTPLPVTGPAGPEGGVATSGSPPLYVQFRLDAPGASNVSLAGSFTNWQPRYELREVAPGVWTAMIPLKPGIHDYLFMVDGTEWVPDPAARPVEDGFGGTNSRLFLARPAAHSS